MLRPPCRRRRLRSSQDEGRALSAGGARGVRDCASRGLPGDKGNGYDDRLGANMRTACLRFAGGLLGALWVLHALVAPPPSAPSTAWHDGGFHIDVPSVLHRSDIFLGRPNADASEAMPLGNGRLGVAVWAAEGLTAQLNRDDTLPDRLSPRQAEIPGLSALTAASDLSGRLDLYNG